MELNAQSQVTKSAKSHETVDLIDKIGLDVFNHIIGYLKPWERISLRSICKEFYKIDCIQIHKCEDYYDYFEKLWELNFQRSVIQLFCRPLMVQHTDFFEYHTLLRISMDGLSRYPQLIQSIKYAFLFQNEFAKSELNNQRLSKFSKHIRELQGMYISMRNTNSTDALNKFLCDIFTHYGQPLHDNSKFKFLFFNHCVLGNDGMLKLCKTFLKSIVPSQLEILFVNNDETLGDECIDLLFECIESTLINLKMLCLRNTAITDVTCQIIYVYYQKQYKNICSCNYENDGQADISHRYGEHVIKLKNINITLNKDVSIDGIKILNTLFFVDYNLDVPHNTDCFYNSIAIGTSVTLDSTTDTKLSRRFRFLD